MDYKAEIEDLEIQISMLPVGYISKKNINGNLYHYRQWTENGKVKSKFIKKDELETVVSQIARRKELEKDIPAIMEILHQGSIRAKEVAAQTLAEVKHAMQIDYFE